MEGRVAMYPGRFQPFHNGHSAIIYHFWESRWNNGKTPSIVIGAINNKVRTFNNPFLGEEVFEIVNLSLTDLDLATYAKVRLIDLPTDRYIGKWIRKTIEEHKIQILLTGNSEMAGMAKGIRGLSVFNPVDGSISKIRSSHIRWMIAGGEDNWKGLVTDSVGEYISQLPINWNDLPEGRKRSWSY